MKADILTIGDELLIGQVINTNQAFIAERLNSVGISINRMLTIGDDEEEILRAFEEGFRSVDIICVTGGLGPTHDDITKEVICKFFDTALVMDAPSLQRIEERMALRNLPVNELSRNQALVPMGCTVIPNHKGAAPGILFQKDQKYFIAMPGVPIEMKSMMESFVVPYFASLDIGNAIGHRTIKTAGIAESLLAESLGNIDQLLGDRSKVSLAFLPSQVGVRIRITVHGQSQEEVNTLLQDVELKIRSKAGKYIYATDSQELENIVGDLLNEQHLTLATAESCTGGFLAHRITNVPGSSGYFLRGFVTYSNQAKVDDLDVPIEIIVKHGAVSKEVAERMAEGARKRSNTHIGISVTGIAGPSGGTAEKPVGTCWIGYSDQETTFALKFYFGDDRIQFKDRATQASLNLLRRKLLHID